MAFWFATPGDAQQHAPLKRFDPAYWTVNFPRPMMASVVTQGDHGLRVDAAFYRANDLAGLIWASEDRADHPLIAYETSRDYRGLTLSFRWRSAGVLPLDAVNGPTLTIEGRDAAGTPRAWYVRLWNYAQGTPEDATVTLDFDALAGGFVLPAEADPVWAGDIDRLFVSMVPQGYTGVDAPLGAPVEGWVELDGLVCDGAASVLQLGDVMVPPHGRAIATGYDDSYHLTPERLLRNALHLGYRGSINHYVGMSHFFRLDTAGLVTRTGGPLNAPCARWHADFLARAKALDLSVILSLSYELLAAHCPDAWQQRAFDGAPARTGWVPPSALLSPAHGDAMAYLQAVARAFVGLAVAAGQAPRFQVGEPWWWVMPDGRICLYDAAAKAALGGNPVEIASVRSATLTGPQKALLDAAGELLAASTQALVAAVRADHPACERLILVYLPTVLDAAAPDLVRANVPTGWAAPAFDILQLEDYDWVTAGQTEASRRGAAAMAARLGYPAAQRHYLAGFVLSPADRLQWRAIDDAADAHDAAETFIWALPQVMRDGFTHFRIGDAPMDAFDDVDFPLAIGLGAEVSPTFSTAVVTTASGHEQRNAAWASGRLQFDAGPGVRSESDVQTLLAFFRARRGAAKAFRFRDPLDHSSNAMTGPPTPGDVVLGEGDGARVRFDLVKLYGDGDEAEVRPITRPVSGSIRVALGGAEQVTGWRFADGAILFDGAPAAGVSVTAGFLFDVPVRFEADRLDIAVHRPEAGDVPHVPLIEVREG